MRDNQCIAFYRWNCTSRCSPAKINNLRMQVYHFPRQGHVYNPDPNLVYMAGNPCASNVMSYLRYPTHSTIVHESHKILTN